MIPSSKILIVTLGSFNKAEGGTHEYNEQDSILARLPPGSRFQLMEGRAKVFKWMKEDLTAKSQGMSIADHQYNKGLVRGRDLGGNDESALYLPALERFNGKFFLSLGKEGKQEVVLSQHHILVLGGLYGLSTLMEPIQLNNCPVETNLKNFDIWTEDYPLTDILLEYIKQYEIKRIFDLADIQPRHRLISWPAIHNQLEGNVLHCFSTVGAGDDALIPLGQFMTKFLLKASTEKLLAINPESEETGIVFRDIDRPRSDMPRETELHAWNEADQIERRRRGIIRYLDKIEKSSGTQYETTRNRVKRLEQKGKINADVRRAMETILRWRNAIVYREHLPGKTESSEIESEWIILTQQVEKHKWKIEEFR